MHWELEENKCRAMNDEERIKMPCVLETEIGINSEHYTESGRCQRSTEVLDQRVIILLFEF